MIAVINYGMGNVKSIINAVNYLGKKAILTADKKKIDNASHIILPGVGAFGNAMDKLSRKGLVGILKRQVFDKKKPFLGICLGLQLLADRSYEHGFHKGLGWISGEVKKFSLNEKKFKIPHIGWNEIRIVRRHPLFSGLRDNELTFYFVHSYHIVCKNPQDIAATCSYGENFPAVIAKENLVATQFHPEKSQDNGIQLLQNFLSWDP